MSTETKQTIANAEQIIEILEGYGDDTISNPAGDAMSAGRGSPRRYATANEVAEVIRNLLAIAAPSPAPDWSKGVTPGGREWEAKNWSCGPNDNGCWICCGGLGFFAYLSGRVETAGSSREHEHAIHSNAWPIPASCFVDIDRILDEREKPAFTPTPHEPVEGVTLWNSYSPNNSSDGSWIRVDGGFCGFLWENGRIDSCGKTEMFAASFPRVCGIPSQVDFAAFRDRVRAERSAKPKPETIIVDDSDGQPRMVEAVPVVPEMTLEQAVKYLFDRKAAVDAAKADIDEAFAHLERVCGVLATAGRGAGK